MDDMRVVEIAMDCEFVGEESRVLFFYFFYFG
jgi:hypothetical protein